MIFQFHEKHGKHISYSPLEVEHNNKHGWRTVSKDEFYATSPFVKTVSDEFCDTKNTVENTETVSLADLYESKFGKKPHHRMKPSTIEAAINGNSI